MQTNTLFTKYINVVNQAIGAHKNERLFSILMSGGKKVLGDKAIGVAVYDSDPGKPIDYFTVHWKDSGTFAIESHGKEAPDVEWKVAKDHLETVTRDPQPFIERPFKLDIDWLRKRLAS